MSNKYNNYIVNLIDSYVTIEYVSVGTNKPTYDRVRLAHYFEPSGKEGIPDKLKFIGIAPDELKGDFFRIVSVNNYADYANDNLLGFIFEEDNYVKGYFDLVIINSNPAGGTGFITLRKLCDFKDDIYKYDSSSLRNKSVFIDKMLIYFF